MRVLVGECVFWVHFFVGSWTFQISFFPKKPFNCRKCVFGSYTDNTLNHWEQEKDCWALHGIETNDPVAVRNVNLVNVSSSSLCCCFFRSLSSLSSGLFYFSLFSSSSYFSPLALSLYSFIVSVRCLSQFPHMFQSFYYIKKIKVKMHNFKHFTRHFHFDEDFFVLFF